MLKLGDLLLHIAKKKKNLVKKKRNLFCRGLVLELGDFLLGIACETRVAVHGSLREKAKKEKKEQKIQRPIMFSLQKDTIGSRLRMCSKLIMCSKLNT